MTQEEKARAYDEALKRARFYYGNCPSTSEKKKLEEMFPKLRESNDERIRKVLLDCFGKYTTLLVDNDISSEQVISYLEKQKDASKAIEAVERIDKYIDEHVANAHDMKDSNPDKKYYRGWDDALGKMSGILQDVYSEEKKKESLRDYIDDFPYSDEQKEQKPTATINGEPIPTENQSVDIPLTEWSYNNRIQYDSVKSGIEAFASTYSFNIESKLFPQLTKKQQQLWREEIEQAVVAGGEYGIELSRDNRYKENRTIEWSEEDEDYMNAIITIINRETALYPRGGATEDLNNDLIAWLKSRCPNKQD